MEIDHQMLANHLSFTSQGSGDHHEDDDESRYHHHDINESENRDAAKLGRTVPNAVHKDRHQKTDDRCEDLYTDICRLSCESQSDSRQTGEQWMSERREEATNDDGQCQRAAASLCGAAVIKNVFSHRESQRGHRGVHDSIYHAVEFVFLPKEKDEQDQGLADLFNDRRRDDRGERVARVGVRQDGDKARAAGVDEEREERGK